jgi:hypothetical protein
VTGQVNGNRIDVGGKSINLCLPEKAGTPGAVNKNNGRFFRIQRPISRKIPDSVRFPFLHLSLLLNIPQSGSHPTVAATPPVLY